MTDFRMPVIDGGELVKIVRKSQGPNKDTVIMFITANPEQTKNFVNSYENIVILEKPISENLLALNSLIISVCIIKDL